MWVSETGNIGDLLLVFGNTDAKWLAVKGDGEL